MARPVTLFTGQWADLPIAELAAKCGEWGFDGLELASWGDHFDVVRALEEDGYCAERRTLLESHGLGCWAISNHLVGQAVCDPIDVRHQAIVPPEVWGDGDPDGVRARAAERMKDTARAAARFGVEVVTGFTGSPVWHMLYSFPPNDFDEIERGYERFAEAWGPIIDVFDAEGVRSRCTRPRSPTTSSRRARRWRRWTTGRASGSTSTRATSSPSCWTRPRSSTSSRSGSITCT
jgi:sugar phosphate isomerase/epimerase